MDKAFLSPSNAAFAIRLQIVLVTKHRQPMLTPEVLDYLAPVFAKILTPSRCSLAKFAGSTDHVRLLVDIHPAVTISSLVNRLKTASARRCGVTFGDLGSRTSTGSTFWHRAYLVTSIGDANDELVADYVARRGTSARAGRRPAVRDGAALPRSPAVAAFAGATT